MYLLVPYNDEMVLARGGPFAICEIRQTPVKLLSAIRIIIERYGYGYGYANMEVSFFD